MDDSQELSEFRALFGSSNYRSDSKDYYDWYIFKNPYKPGKIYLEYIDGRVVGSCSISPRRMLVNGKSILAGQN